MARRVPQRGRLACPRIEERRGRTLDRARTDARLDARGALPADCVQGDGEFVFCHPKRGTSIGEEWFADRLRAALKAVGITERVRPFHDLRHTAITNDAAAGSSELAVMAKAGHRSMETTRQYLHLAGVVFRGEAEALEARVLGVESSTDLSEPQRTSAHTNPLGSGNGSLTTRLHRTAEYAGNL
jgi:integrase